MKNKKERQYSAAEDAALRDVVEAALDRKYYQLDLPHPNKTLALWYLLTVSEDFQRGMFADIGGRAKDSTIEYQIDRLKYSLRFGLERIFKESTNLSNTPVPRRIIPKIYTKTAKLVHGGLEYMAGSQVCAAAHAGTLRFLQHEEGVKVVFDERYHDRGYAAIELMGHQGPNAVDFVALLFVWIRHSNERAPEVLRRIASTVRIRKRLLEYDYEPTLSYQLAKKMPQQPFLIPDGWKFSWGGRYETTLLLNSLSVRCMYHLVAVHFGAAQHELRGGGHESICMVIDKNQLLEDIALLSSLSKQTISRFVEFITYGRNTQTPDPALQPLVPLGDGKFGLACIHFLSSHSERNLLSLQARVDRVKFDALSDLFETDMVSRLFDNLSKKWPHVRANFELTIDGIKEEIDLLIADEDSRTLLLCELRWMLPPGDSREVQNRKRVCYQKVEQLERKVLWARVGASKLYHHAFPNSGKIDDESPWHVLGVVVIENFGGAKSTKVEYPIMTSALFELGMKHAASVKHFGEWSQSLVWLPQDGLQFEVAPRKIEVADQQLECPGMDRLQTRREYLDYVVGTLTTS